MLLSSIYPVCDLLEDVKRLVLRRILMKRVTAGYERSFGEGSVLPVHQKPEDLTRPPAHFTVNICKQSCLDKRVNYCTRSSISQGR